MLDQVFHWCFVCTRLNLHVYFNVIFKQPTANRKKSLQSLWLHSVTKVLTTEPVVVFVQSEPAFHRTWWRRKHCYSELFSMSVVSLSGENHGGKYFQSLFLPLIQTFYRTFRPLLGLGSHWPLLPCFLRPPGAHKHTKYTYVQLWLTRAFTNLHTRRDL